MSNSKFIIGIDEAGRGSLAGPVYVGLVKAPANFDFGIYDNLDDSKKMTEKRRVKLINKIKSQNGTLLQISTSYSTAGTIDKYGITRAVDMAIRRGLHKMNTVIRDSHVYLDGLLRAPKVYSQETIVGGDGKVPIISMASVVAKVNRDKHMERIHKLYPQYCLDKNKGYGTKEHRKFISEFGSSEKHRQSYIENIIT